MNRRTFSLMSIFAATNAAVLAKSGIAVNLTKIRNNQLPILIEQSLIPIKEDNIEVAQNEGDQIMLINSYHERILLSSVGSVVWSYINGSNTCEEIANLLSYEFAINYEQSLEDVNNFLVNLERERFINITVKQCYAVEVEKPLQEKMLI